jgi:predicted MFS family arabinose efflux permease
MFACAVAGPALVMTAASAPTPFYVGLTETLGLSPLQVAELFSAYVGPLLLALVFAGSLSDHLGRRPVLCGGFLALAGSTMMLWQADAFGLLLGARVVQGIATGGLIAAVSATVFDFEPEGRHGLAGAANSASVMIGLALGAAGSGALVDHVADAWSVVFGGLTAVFVASAALVWLLPETSTREPGALRSLVPRFSVPQASRRPLARATPVLVAGWATGGVHLSLGGLIVRDTLEIRGALGQSVVLTVLATVGAGACWATRRWQATRMTVVATATLAVGTVVIMAACAVSSLIGVVLGAAVGGVGFGTAFLAVVRTLEPTVDPARKGELLAAVYVISYLAYGLPAILAGVLASTSGPPTALYAAGSAITILAAGAAVASLRHPERAVSPARRPRGRRHV